MTRQQRKILLAVQDLGGQNVRIRAIQRKLGGAKSGIHRKLHRLIAEGYMSHVPARGYSLTRPVPTITEYQVWCPVFKTLVPFDPNARDYDERLVAAVALEGL